MYNTTVDVPMYIGDKQVFTNDKRNLTPPHEHKHVIGTSNYGGEKEVRDAIDAAMASTRKMGKYELGTQSFYLFKSC